MLSIDACLRDIEAVLMNTTVASITKNDRIVKERLWISADATRLIVAVGRCFDGGHHARDRQEKGNAKKRESHEGKKAK